MEGSDSFSTHLRGDTWAIFTARVTNGDHLPCFYLISKFPCGTLIFHLHNQDFPLESGKLTHEIEDQSDQKCKTKPCCSQITVSLQKTCDITLAFI